MPKQLVQGIRIQVDTEQKPEQNMETAPTKTRSESAPIPKKWSKKKKKKHGIFSNKPKTF